MGHRPLLRCIAVSAICAACNVPHAQTVSPPATRLEPVEVTGTRLRRIDTETPSPVQILSREAIERSSAVSVGDVLQSLPANNTGTFNEHDVLGSTGASAVSLRGLGPQSTLVLVNGRRVAPFGFTAFSQYSFVDVHQIPLAVVERIEVLLDGASAIYGSDAIAGVVNVILRREMRGVEATASLGRSTHGDADLRQLSFAVGRGTLGADGYNVFAAYSHADRDGVKASARDITRSADLRRFGLADFRSAFAYPGNLYRSNNVTFLQPLAPCVPLVEPGAAGNGRCIYDHTQFRDLATESRRDALLLAGTASLGANGFEAFGDATLGRTAFRQQGTSFASSTYFNNGTLPDPFIRLPVGHPQNPYGFEVALRTRFADVPQFVEPTSDTLRTVLGLRHADLAGWSIETALLRSASRTRIVTTGLVDDSVLSDELLDANGRARIDFRFGDPAANDPALMARLYPTLADIGRTRSDALDVRASREFGRLPGGGIGLAVGGEVRRERYQTVPDPRVAAGDVSVISSFSADGRRSVSAAYAEIALPATPTLELSLAGRVDRYSDFGSSANPKLGIKWKPHAALALRTTYATAFRAPALTETAQTPNRSFVRVRDPRTCPIPDPGNLNCERSVVAILGAGPELQPERARSVTAGVVVEPAPGVSIAVDAFRIRRRDQIASLDPEYLLANEGSFPGLVMRRTDGTLQQLNLAYTNLGSTTVEGIDLDAKAWRTVDGIGRLGAEATLERLPHYRVAATRDAPVLDYAGTYTQPKLRARLGLHVERGPWRLGLAVHHTGGYLRAFTPNDLSCAYDANGTNRPELCRVAAWRTTDLSVGYRGLRDVELGLLVANLADKAPPFDERMATRFTAYQPVFHDATGRFVRLSAKLWFR